MAAALLASATGACEQLPARLPVTCTAAAAVVVVVAAAAVVAKAGVAHEAHCWKHALVGAVVRMWAQHDPMRAEFLPAPWPSPSRSR